MRQANVRGGLDHREIAECSDRAAQVDDARDVIGVAKKLERDEPGLALVEARHHHDMGETALGWDHDDVREFANRSVDAAD
jgi:hypothetical protein